MARSQPPTSTQHQSSPTPDAESWLDRLGEHVADAFLRSGYKIPLLLNVAILVGLVLVPLLGLWLVDDQAKVRNFQVIALTLTTAAMSVALLMPFFSLVNNASSTRHTINSVHSDIKRLRSAAAVEVRPRTDNTHVVDFVQAHDAPTVFLGFYDAGLIQGLLSAIGGKAQSSLYIHPRVLPTLITILDEVQAIRTITDRTYITDCPRDSCTAFGHDREGNRTCTILRGVPLQNTWWSATLDPKSDYTEHLYKTYMDVYKDSSTLLNSYLKAALLARVYQERRDENVDVIKKNVLTVYSWKRLYRYATEIVRHARDSVYAVDFTPPRLWITSDGIMREYRDAHVNVTGTNKVRIHGFISASLPKTARSYEIMIRQHKEMGVALMFMEKSQIRVRGIDKGFAVVDDQILVRSQDVQGFEGRDTIPLEDLRYNIESASVVFDTSAVKEARLRFEDLHRVKEHLLSAEQFENELKQHLPG